MPPATGVNILRVKQKTSVSQALPKMDQLESDSKGSTRDPFEFDFVGTQLRIGSERETVLRVATTGSQREKAWRLAHLVYRHKKYTRANGSGLLYGVHDAHPRTTTFLAERKASATAALTLLFDSPLHLPADEIFGPELDALRAQRRQICELVSLVCRERDQFSAETIRWLFKLAYFTASCIEHATDFLITVNPKHVTYYEKLLLFERLGEVKCAPKVNGAEAILLRLDLTSATERYRERYSRFPANRNLFRYFMHRGDEVLDWLVRSRRPLQPHELIRYFSNRRLDPTRPPMPCLRPRGERANAPLKK